MWLYKLPILLPLCGAIIGAAYILLRLALPMQSKSRRVMDTLAWCSTTIIMGISAIVAVIVFQQVAFDGQGQTIILLYWFNSGDIYANWAIHLDTLSVVMIAVVNMVSFLVHVYAWGYMKEDASIPRFMSYLSLFTFCMLMLVSADNLIQLFFGWEGVGLSSYLLIGFWFEKSSATKAANKAFIVNRVGDVAFALGIFAIFHLFHVVQLSDIIAMASDKNITEKYYTLWGYQWHALTVIAVLLFIGAMGKSAQIGLHIWLPDAMEGPTPVSALIHAATMVTAGVFMVSRLSPLFEQAPMALTLITLVGAATTLFAATIACVQNDIKRIIAYSTASQLGYMFLALGLSGYQAGIFHLTTHAFFKALLFLSAGAVIVAMHHEQDIRKMGNGLWKKIPATYILMWIGSLALAGIPPFAGYYSKDLILEIAWASNAPFAGFAYYLALTTAFLTAFYSWRLLILVFHGSKITSHHGDKHEHQEHDNHHKQKVPLTMLLPMIVLGIATIGAGYLLHNDFVGELMNAFWKESMPILAESPITNAHHIPWLPKMAPLFISLAGMLLAYIMYVGAPQLPKKFQALFPKIHKFLYNRWYVDELYQAIIIKPLWGVSKIFYDNIDKGFIDKYGPNGIASMIFRMARQWSKWQTGYVYHYALMMIAGLVCILSWTVLKGL